jgi:hypothetical protein
VSPVPEAIFVVGVSRSGTSLMRRVIEGSGAAAIATENHYLGHLLPGQGARHHFRRCGDLRDDATIRCIVELVYEGGYQRASRLREVSPFWRWLVRSIPREDLEARLLAADRTERGQFAALLRAYADKRRRPVMGEKTPAHLRYADTLLDWFPDGRVVHMLRDPRAVYVSELRRRSEHAVGLPYRQLAAVPALFAAFVLGEVTATWADAANRHRELASRYPGRYLAVRFEDLVTQPEREVERLFEFLGLEAGDTLARQRVVSKGYQQGSKGMDAAAATRWRDQIGGWEEGWLRMCLGSRMRRLGYLGPDEL